MTDHLWSVEEIVALLGWSAMVVKWFYRIAITIGCGLLGVSSALYILLHRAAVAEQALSPGKDSFGVAALGMMYGRPIIATASVGVLSLLAGVSALAFQRLRNPN